MKPCPLCAEKIQDAAIKCRFCGEMLASFPESPEPTGTQKPRLDVAHVVGAAMPSWIRSAWCDRKVRYSALVFLMLGVVAFATVRWNNRPEAEGTVVASAKREPGERSEADYRKALVLMLEKAPLIRTVFVSRLGSIETALRDAYVFSMIPRVGGGRAATWAYRDAPSNTFYVVEATGSAGVFTVEFQIGRAGQEGSYKVDIGNGAVERIFDHFSGAFGH